PPGLGDPGRPLTPRSRTRVTGSTNPLRTVALATLLALSVFARPSGGAQETVVLQGIGAEESGRLIASATITLLGPQIEARRAEDGVFVFPAAPMGRVLLRVRAAGYPTVVEQVDVTQDSI